MCLTRSHRNNIIPSYVGAGIIVSAEISHTANEMIDIAKFPQNETLSYDRIVGMTDRCGALSSPTHLLYSARLTRTMLPKD